MFVTRCKFAALPLASASSGKATQQQQQLLRQQTLSSQQQEHSQQQQPKRGRLKLLLIEDLPYVGEASRRARLAAALQDLATTARCPVVVVATTEEGTSSGSSRTGGGYGGAAGAAASSKGLHKVGRWAALCSACVLKGLWLRSKFVLSLAQHPSPCRSLSCSCESCVDLGTNIVTLAVVEQCSRIELTRLQCGGNSYEHQAVCQPRRYQTRLDDPPHQPD